MKWCFRAGAAAGLLVVAIFPLAGCARTSDSGESATPAPGAEAPAVSPGEPRPPATAPPNQPDASSGAGRDTSGAQWTAGIVDRRRPGVRMTVLAAVRTARHPGFDRVVFELAGADLPGYHLEYVDRPVRQCGSGDAVEIAGDGWLAVRLQPSQAHDDQGRATVQDRARKPGLPVLKELRLVCDFEGQVEWVLGVASPNRFRVMELREPARLVVDVRH